MNINESLLDFIYESPTAYQAVDSVRRELLSLGYTELTLGESWQLSLGKGYFVTKNGSSIIAFRYGEGGYMIGASHSDSPSFRLKRGEASVGAYTKLDVEKYGGMIYYTWLDRPLSLAGRAVVKAECGVEVKLLDIKRPIAIIPSLAIHMNRSVNDGYKFNPAKDLVPLASSGECDILELIAEAASVRKEDVISHDLFLYPAERGAVIGAKEDLVASPRLDDLASVYTAMRGFIDARKSKNSVPVLAIFDNEEVGSETKQGAASTFLYDVLRAIANDERDYISRIRNSFMVSADNAHALHPNHPELSDAKNAPKLNSGIVIKFNANQKYATDGVSDALFRTICERAGISVQTFYNRADMPGGSTLGSISDTRVSVPTVDIGIPQLAMHSSYEVAGASDINDMYIAHREFFSSALSVKGEKINIT